MDPNSTLARLRELAATINERVDDERARHPGGEPVTEIEFEFADAFEALDEWLSKGGFLPANWQWRKE